MKQYKQLNIIGGWVTFLLSAFVYLSTMEPTASFWDCGEFIASSYKLLVGHPPGAPVFMLTGRIFTLFAGDPTRVALMVNALSALASAATIMFLFWTITHLAKKLIIKNESDIALGDTIAVIGAGLLGSLAYAFSDTFWFSAVEGEVYASSSLFTAIVFWAILKWENEEGQPYAKRWIIFIGYLVGLSIGVHLLNLLAIPAIGLVYYFKKYKVTTKGTFIALAISSAILLIIMYGIIPGTVQLAAAFELFFINIIGLPYNSGVFVFIILVITGMGYGIYRTQKMGSVLWNTALTFVAVILIGYSSFAVIIIRSNANPPMDQNSPDNLFSLLSYLNREQYGDRPLFYGHYYSAPIKEVSEGRPVRIQSGGKYKTIDHKQEVEYAKEASGIFPRMYSAQETHMRAYKQWADIKGNKVKAFNRQTGKTETVVKPTFTENIRFFVKYQCNFMYWRYFMWNFSGRQNDIQGHGNVLHGNWITGINAIDKARLGADSELVPDSMKANKANNKYYLLPLLLGILGIVFQMAKWKEEGRESFLLVLMLFFMTGLAIVIYLNQYPYQPRERDYAYAGSFYAFTIWIGIGLLYVYEGLKKVGPKVPTAIASTVILLAVPALMASENWDDHDRSDRYMTRDFAKNYLNSCDENAIIFTNGDNDTFPLWYAQEVEGERTDVRVCNLSYLQTDWYINQMRQRAYNSAPLPYSLSKDKTIQGQRDYVYILDRYNGKTLDLKRAIDFLGSDDVETKRVPEYRNQMLDHLPAKKFSMQVDSAFVVANGTVAKGKEDRIEKEFIVDLSKKRGIRKNDLMVLDLLASNNWERPVYYAVTVPSSSYVNLQNYFHTEGLTYRISPVKAKRARGESGEVNTDKMYDNMMNKFVWGNIDKPGIFLDENTMRMCLNYRNNFVRLANALIDEGKIDKAVKVLKKSFEVLPEENVPYNQWAVPLVESCYAAGLIDEGNHIIESIGRDQKQKIIYYNSMKPIHSSQLQQETQESIYILWRLGVIANIKGQKEIGDKINTDINDLSKQFQVVGRTVQQMMQMK